MRPQGVNPLPPCGPGPESRRCSPPRCSSRSSRRGLSQPGFDLGKKLKTLVEIGEYLNNDD